MNCNKKYILIFILAMVLVVELFLSLLLGSVDLSLQDIWQTVINGIISDKSVDAPGQGPLHDIIWILRIPRVLLACIAGAGLAVCGVVMQAIIKNPLADPYIMGISSGASLGATVAILLGLGSGVFSNFIGVAAFLGALGVSVLVLLLANIGGGVNAVKLLLIGMALSMVCSALSSFVVYFAQDKDGIQTITFWLMGSFAGADWLSLPVVSAIIICGILFFVIQNRVLDMMLFGDETAITLGIDIRKYRQIYMLISSLMVGFIVYSAGMIGFVGLLVPHVARIAIGTEHRFLLPMSGLMGAILLVLADVVCRSLIEHTEIPVGIIISLIGAPCFVYMIIRKAYGFGR
ncbi:iron complex transport system permease protein [Anaerovibrio lipolyticus DSM 3074]|jgi:iron complex transport system permease protein|uniref:ABC transporter n=2 Tax=Anaerovibrio lipolyticus TaxID=82374 RepID=A0A0B2JRU6_9FIRM|nr:iron ABC transporter permease [Anaerovibrio lipolyticus]KHM51065.1 ABC transporter [Anaerovibrio lipolyticus]SHI68990.1 iron complex transport system permease protein [Anaerovibrio lipolyticus DSM 3074]